MFTKFFAWMMSALTAFGFWIVTAQPNDTPETRTPPFEGELAPDKYSIWPTEEFTVATDPFLWGGGLELLYSAQGLVSGGGKNESLLVLQKGKLVYEHYADGWDAEKPHAMYSVTKSVLSALVGIAIGEGKIKGIDQKVIDFYPDAVIAPGQESKRDMTVGHLLTMTSGLPGDGNATVYPDASVTDYYKFAFELPQVTAPGKRFAYSSFAGSAALAGVVERAVGKSIFDYAKEKLFDPIGMQSVQWSKNPDGSHPGGYGISMTPRDMLRFGYLYLNYGRWEDRQIIPAGWIAVTPPKSKLPMAYGNLFWNFPLLPLGDSYEAIGVTGQFITILPEYDTVIVRTGSAGALNNLFDGIFGLFGLS